MAGLALRRYYGLRSDGTYLILLQEWLLTVALLQFTPGTGCVSKGDVDDMHLLDEKGEAHGRSKGWSQWQVG